MAATELEAGTLGWALGRVIAAARRRGVLPTTVRKHFVVHGRYLARFWSPAVRLDRIDRDAVEAFLSWARSDVDRDGSVKAVRCENTLIEKDLPLLSHCLRVGGLPVAPVLEARNRPRRSPRVTDHFRRGEVDELLRRMRTEEFHDPRGRPLVLSARAWHADVLEFLVVSGVRTGELARIRIADVRDDHVRVKSRDRLRPRDIPLTPDLVVLVQRLVRRARERGSDRLVPGGMDFVSGICARWKRRLGEPRLCGRILRNTCIATALAAGAPIQDVMSLAGHRRASTTRRYVPAQEENGPSERTLGRPDRLSEG